MDKPKVTPKDFFLWAGAMIALYVSVFSLISLIFSYIDTVFPDALDYSYDPYSSSMRFYIASLVVLFPLVLVLMRLIRKDIARDESRKEIWVRRWALMLTVFVAGATIAGDLIALINTFLGGEITTRFALKVLVVFLVAGGGFLHFLADIKGYWVKNPHYARMIGWGVAALIACTVVAGFFIIGTPSQIRLYRFDDEKINSLQNIQFQILSYWQSKERLPNTLLDLEDPLSGYSVPVDSQTKAPYRYEPTGSNSFKLCATFNAETQKNSPTHSRGMYMEPAYAGGGTDALMNAWEHGPGEVCFERTIDPERYPPFSKTAPVR
ncbi:MAG: hypothetical protein RIQ56_897 [Candidatus Parcubacteria bacterium]|jgi:hypothetical protein